MHIVTILPGMGFDGDDASQEIPAPPAASKIKKILLTKDYHQTVFDWETSGRGNLVCRLEGSKKVTKGR